MNIRDFSERNLFGFDLADLVKVRSTGVVNDGDIYDFELENDFLLSFDERTNWGYCITTSFNEYRFTPVFRCDIERVSLEFVPFGGAEWERLNEVVGFVFSDSDKCQFGGIIE